MHKAICTEKAGRLLKKELACYYDKQSQGKIMGPGQG
jgi:hypothetical protein